MQERTGAYISGGGHGLLILWAIIGGVLFRADPEEALSVSEVSLITSEEFAALMPAGPVAETEVPAPQPQAAEEAPAEPAPEPATQADTPPPVPETPVVPEPPAPPQVEEAPPPPPAPTEVTPVAPETPLPPATETSAPTVGKSPDLPKPAPAPRVAPKPAEAPAPEAVTAEAVQEATTPDPTAEATPAEPQEAAAPEEAATEIVTEAERIALAPVQSERPRTRPERVATPVVAPKPVETTPKPAAATPKPAPAPAPAEEVDPVAAALATALAEEAKPSPAPATTQTTAPSGPPLTGSEKEGLRIAVSNCWNVGSLSSDALRVTVTVAVSISEDGKPRADTIRMLGAEGGSNAGAAQAYEAARRAIIRCGAQGFDLPREKYSQWKDVEMVFNPEKMRIK